MTITQAGSVFVLHQSPVQFSSFRMHFATFSSSSHLICNFFLLFLRPNLSRFMPKKKLACKEFYVIVTRSMFIHFLIMRLYLFSIQCNNFILPFLSLVTLIGSENDDKRNSKVDWVDTLEVISLTILLYFVFLEGHFWMRSGIWLWLRICSYNCIAKVG